MNRVFHIPLYFTNDNQAVFFQLTHFLQYIILSIPHLPVGKLFISNSPYYVLHDFWFNFSIPVGYVVAQAKE